MRPVTTPALVSRILIALMAVVLSMAGTMARAEIPARPEGPVLDAASVIPDADETALDAKLRTYTQSTGRALMVVTVPSLDGEDVATYANNLGHTWGLGGKESDQGLILLVAPTERKVRIEVGYGLEGYLPDVLAGRIIREQITPKFKAGDLPGGINAGIDAIITQLNRDPADAKAVAEAAAAAQAQRSSNSDGGIGSAILWVIFMIVLISIFSRRGRRGYRRSGIDPGIVLWGISEAMRGSHGGGGGWSGGDSGGSDWGGFGGGDFGGGGASGDW